MNIPVGPRCADSLQASGDEQRYFAAERRSRPHQRRGRQWPGAGPGMRGSSDRNNCQRFLPVVPIAATEKRLGISKKGHESKV